jgi:hypothetical protein
MHGLRVKAPTRWAVLSMGKVTTNSEHITESLLVCQYNSTNIHIFPIMELAGACKNAGMKLEEILIHNFLLCRSRFHNGKKQCHDLVTDIEYARLKT